MTKIIVGQLRQNRFRLGDFYLARLRRIWPVLLVLCAVLLIAGPFFLDPWSYARLTADAPSAIGFFSNMVFASRIGYFRPIQNDAWLLHTWSLSVEWQFYLLYPLTLLGLFAVKALKRHTALILAGLGLLSFALCMLLWDRASDAAFYLLPGRAWELLAGAFCMSIEERARLPRFARLAGHVCGLGMIAAGALLVDPGPAWPSPMAVLPVGGALLVIASGLRSAAWAGNPVDLIGRASYSIYIWHWPLIVALRQAGIAFTLPVMLGALVAIMAAGLASYWVIERRATPWVFATRRRRWGALAGVCVLALFSLVATQMQGFEAMRASGLAPSVRASMADDRVARADGAYPGACARVVRQGRLQLCQIGDPAARQVVVVGDSQAAQFAPRFAHTFDARPGAGITFVAHDGCLPIPGLVEQRNARVCAEWADKAYRWVERAGFQRVVVISRWPVYFGPAPGGAVLRTCAGQGRDCLGVLHRARQPADAVFQRLADEVTRLQGLGAQVVLMGPTPAGPGADPALLYQRAFSSNDLDAPPILRSAFEAETGYLRSELQRVSLQTGATFVDPLDGLCPRGLCPVTDGGRAIYRDAAHFRASAVTGARFAFLDPWLAPLGPALAPTTLEIEPHPVRP